MPTIKDEEVVVLSEVLPASVNVGYHDSGSDIITAVNGNEIHNLKDLISEVEKGKKRPFVSFTGTNGFKYVLDRKKAEQEHEKILRTYNIPSDRSANF